MNGNSSWLDVLSDELRQRGLGAELTEHVVAEAAAHLLDSGEPPLSVFGPPGEYASAIADSLGDPVRPSTSQRPSASQRPSTFQRPRPPHPDTAPGAVLLDARGITKRYRRRTVLANVDLTVRAGQVAAVIGANGCGKSTFLRVCAGLVSPDHGTVRVRGTLGYCPQDSGICELLTPDDHFVLIGAGRGMSRPAARDTGRAHATRLGWATVGGITARNLSGGTRQKLNLVMAELGEPDVLLLDEPYQGFDQGSYLDFWHEVWRWRDAGKAIVVVTHLLNQLDRVDIVLDLTPAEAVLV